MTLKVSSELQPSHEEQSYVNGCSENTKSEQGSDKSSSESNRKPLSVLRNMGQRPEDSGKVYDVLEDEDTTKRIKRKNALLQRQNEQLKKNNMDLSKENASLRQNVAQLREHTFQLQLCIYRLQFSSCGTVDGAGDGTQPVLRVHRHKPMLQRSASAGELP